MEKAYTMAEEPYTRIYARIDLDAIVKNMEAMRENLPAKTKMIGVVKTDGYGHGAVPVAKTIAPFVWGYAVATLEEGQNLRRHGIDKPILVLGSTHPRHFAELIEGDIRPAIFEEDKAELLSKLAVSMGKTAKMHIALDTGMGRIGFHPDENSLKEIERIAKLPGIEIEGMFTHFARADEADKAFTHLQYERYQKFHEGLENAGVHIPMCHCANSAAIMELPRMGLDAARAGITVYGLYPSDEVERNMKIYPAMEIRSFITYVKEVEPGTPVRIRNWIASLLYDPASDGNISETVRQGAVATVVACTETLRGGKRTWAYQLASGDFVLAYNAEPLPPETPRASFTGAAAAATDTGEVLTFAGSGTPLAYTNMVDGALVMDFYDADFAADFAVSGSALVQSAAVDPGDSCTRVTLTFTQPVWGHTVEYADGTTQVILKKQPVRSDVFGKPLTGVAVLLDAGHGDHDPGAMGAAGAGAPAEKDVNLALTLAAKYRLEQLGATVQTIRTDDSFLSLEERNRAIVAGQPDFFIAVHHNSIDLSVDANLQTGTECYYFYPAGKALAQALVRNVTQATSRPDRGAQWGYYYVTRSTVCPAVLLEAGFMVNPSEYENVTSEPQLWAAGDAIARSVLECVPPG